MSPTDTTAIGESVALRLMPEQISVTDTTPTSDYADMPWDGAVPVQLGFQQSAYVIQPTI